MSGADGEIKASLLLTLDDQLSAGLTGLMEKLDKLIGVTGDGFTTLGDKLDAAFSKVGPATKKAAEHVGVFEKVLIGLGDTAGAVGKKLDGMWTGAGHFADKIGGIGGAVAGISIVEPVEQYAAYENTLRHIAITEGKSGDTVKPGIDRLTKLFAEDAQKTGQSSDSIAKAYYDLVTTGIPANILDKVIGAHSQAATAYNISPEALGPAVGALLQNFKVPEEKIGSALSAMAQAAKEGRFKVEDFSRELPGVSGFMSSLGMKGREGADYSFAALETVMKNASNPGQAAADFSDALNYLTGNAAKNAFQKNAGIDLPALLQEGEKAGKNPMDTILDKLAEMTKGQDSVKMSETLHGVMHNQQAEQAVMALLQHRDEFNALKTKLDGVDQTTVQRDFSTAVADPITQVRLFHENIEQITRTIGEGFAPALQLVTRVLGDMKDGITALNDAFPVWGPRVEAATGVVGALGAAIGVISMVAGGPVALAIAAVVALGVAAVEIYKHWDGIKQYFTDLWHGVQDAFTAWETWLGAWIGGAMTATIGRIRTAWSGLTDFFAKLWADIRAPFDAFAGDVEAVLQKLHLVSKPATAGAADASAPAPASGGGKGLFHHAAAAPQPPVDVNVHVTHDPGLKVDTATNSGGAVTTQADPNRVVGRD
jgi:TP901 family phage tail tape measure protein